MLKLFLVKTGKLYNFIAYLLYKVKGVINYQIYVEPFSDSPSIKALVKLPAVNIASSLPSTLGAKQKQAPGLGVGAGFFTCRAICTPCDITKNQRPDSYKELRSVSFSCNP